MNMQRVRSQVITVCLWIAVLLATVHFALFVSVAATEATSGFAAYYTASRLVLDGAEMQSFYDDQWFGAQIQNLGIPVRDIWTPNLPTGALILLLLSGLEYMTARILWTLFSMLCLGAAVFVLIRRTGLRGPWLPAALLVVLLFQPLYANLGYGQAYVLALALLVLAWDSFRQRRDAVLGITLALLLLLKTVGILLWPLLVLQRRWQALAWSVGAAAVLLLATLPVFGWAAWWTSVQMLLGVSAEPKLAVTAYQSQHGLLRHLLLFDAQWNPAPLLHAPLLAMWLPTIGFMLVLAVSSYCALRASAGSGGIPQGQGVNVEIKSLSKVRRRSSVTTSRLAVAARPVPDDLVFVAFVVANLVVSPFSLDYHYTILLLPIGVLFAYVRTEPSLWMRIALVVAVLLVAADLPYQSPWLAAGGWALLAYPKLYAAYLLWGLALWASLAYSRRHSENESLLNIYSLRSMRWTRLSEEV